LLYIYTYLYRCRCVDGAANLAPGPQAPDKLYSGKLTNLQIAAVRVGTQALESSTTLIIRQAAAPASSQQTTAASDNVQQLGIHTAHITGRFKPVAFTRPL
jgi:hypothetical protein